MVQLLVFRGVVLGLVIRGRIYLNPTLSSQARAAAKIPLKFISIQPYWADYGDGGVITWMYTG